ncbi:MAG: hypothetical protein IK066_04550 [Kiritimatiellae bacterium]|nr:hypothetical protein [Kiritimatiellia bacterium]
MGARQGWRERARWRIWEAGHRARLGFPLSLREKAWLFVGAMLDWRGGGFALAERRERERRRRICEASPCWKRKPVPHCGVCGCLPVKLRLGGVGCPKGKW